jgi:hypothetical protein
MANVATHYTSTTSNVAERNPFGRRACRPREARTDAAKHGGQARSLNEVSAARIVVTASTHGMAKSHPAD